MDIPRICYELLDYLFISFHSFLIVFNLFGWLFIKTRRWNLLTLLLTALSWFGLGICYGWGYCFCTDWHWQVRQKLGYFNMPNSHIKFLLDLITGFNWPEALVDLLALSGLLLSCICSIVINLKEFRRTK